MDYSCANRTFANLAPALFSAGRESVIERRIIRAFAAAAVILASLVAGCAPESSAGPPDGSGSSVPPGPAQRSPDFYHLRPSNMQFG